MKLNIGCGKDIKDGYINLDRNSDFGPDMLCDAGSLSFPSNSANEIFASDVLEHFPWRVVEDVLREWRRVLHPTGVMIIRTPDLEGMIRLYKERPEGWRRGDAEEAGIDPIVERLYGGQDHEGNYHYAIFDKRSISEILGRAGFFIGSIGPDGKDISNMVLTAYKKLSGDELIDGESSCPQSDSCEILKGFRNSLQHLELVKEESIKICADDIRFYLLSGMDDSGELPDCQRMRDTMDGIKNIRAVWEAPVFGPSGYAYAARNYIAGLDDAGIRICVKPLWGDCKPEPVLENEDA